MRKICSLALALGTIGAMALISSPSFAGPADAEIARIDQLLTDHPGVASARGRTSTGNLAELRDSVAAELRAGDTGLADGQAKLALHELNEDGIPVDSDALALSCIGGCPGSYLPSVSAEQIADGAIVTTRLEPLGQGWRDEPVSEGSSTN
jgi:hypothetical protein